MSGGASHPTAGEPIGEQLEIVPSPFQLSAQASLGHGEGNHDISWFAALLPSYALSLMHTVQRP